MQVLQCGARLLTCKAVEQSWWVSVLCLFWAQQLRHSLPATVFRSEVSQLCPTISGLHRNVRFAFQRFLWRTLQHSLSPFRRKAHRVEWCFRCLCRCPELGSDLANFKLRRATKSSACSLPLRFWLSRLYRTTVYQSIIVRPGHRHRQRATFAS